MQVRLRQTRLWLGVAGLLIVVGGLLIALPIVLQVRSASAGGAGRRPLAADGVATSSSSDGFSSTSASVAPASPASVLASGTAITTAAMSVTPAQVATSTLTAAASRGPSLDAYKGLGSWVDLYDSRAWSDPAATVADMEAHGVRTLYLETSNSRSAFAIKDPASTAAFIQTAHARRMSVVAWYLPDMKKPATDFYRISLAIGFKTADGQRFDSFALDIESSAIKSESTRNRLLNALSARIRAFVGSSYALGAIIPSPVGLAKKMGYWDSFPYASIATDYNVLLPMGYYTYHGRTASAAYDDARANVRIIRAQRGCANVPVHMIGGLADNSSAAQVGSFVRAVRESGCIGASLYSWPRTTAADWRALAAIKP